MKKNYTLKILTTLVLLLLLNLTAEAQVRITSLDPATNTVTLKNFGSSNEPISGLWFCNFPSYAQVNGMTSTSSLNAGEEVVITSSVNFDVGDGEFGLYTDSSFGSSTSIIDYLQWGSINHQREGVAVAAGVWIDNTMITAPPPFEFTGTVGNEVGPSNWQTALSLEGFEKENAVKLFPNPTSDELNIQLLNSLNNTSLSIIDITGKTIITQTLNDSSSSIDVSNLLSGLYLLKLDSDKGSQTRRFVKK